MGAHLLSWALWLGSSLAQEPPPQTQLWADRIKANYKHYQDIGFQFLPQAPAAPPCPSAATRPPPEGAPGWTSTCALAADPESRVCEELRFSSWMLRADLTPEDQRVFAAAAGGGAAGGCGRRGPRPPDGRRRRHRLPQHPRGGAGGGYLVDLHLLRRHGLPATRSRTCCPRSPRARLRGPGGRRPPCGRTGSPEDAAFAPGAPSPRVLRWTSGVCDRARRGGFRPGP